MTVPSPIPDPMLPLLRAHVWDTLFGAAFGFVGVASCLVAAVRRRRESRLLVWFGLFIGLYGARMLAHVAGILNLAQGASWPNAIEIVVNYVLVIPSMLFWTELSKGLIRRIFRWLTVVACGIAALGLSWFLLTGSPDAFLRISLLLAILIIIALGGLLLVPHFAKSYFLLESGVLRVVMPGIALVALIVNGMYFVGFPPAPFIEPVTFAVWIFAIGYEAAKHTFENERRFLAIQSELETARQIQASILPEQVPAVLGLRIAACYKPMSAVAGDFYQFVPMDDGRIGILVADVTGHGVPAALIASMIKVAMQSASDFAPFPDKVLRRLNDILTPELKGRLTSAGYLWIDTQNRIGRYAGAGHPPLLHWSTECDALRRIEANGLLFGVKTGIEYPVQCLRFNSGDRFLLYTDGLSEPENAAGEPFGDRRLENVVEHGRALPPCDLSQKLLVSLEAWRPSATMQQDDITLVLADIV